jgi:hypothetical protein
VQCTVVCLGAAQCLCLQTDTRALQPAALIHARPLAALFPLSAHFTLACALRVLLLLCCCVRWLLATLAGTVLQQSQRARAPLRSQREHTEFGQLTLLHCNRGEHRNAGQDRRAEKRKEDGQSACRVKKTKLTAKRVYSRFQPRTVAAIRRILPTI